MTSMRRTILTTAMLLAVVASTSGCGMLRRGPHYYEIGLEVTGPAEKITYSVPPNSPDESAQPPTGVAAPTVPWKEVRVTTGGEVKLQVTPKDGPVTCRILVEKRQVAKKEGQPGRELTCTATPDK